MVEDGNPTENNSVQEDETSSTNGAEGNIEELKLEDADVEIDFGGEFPGAASGEQVVSDVTDEGDAADSDADVATLEEKIAQLQSQLEDRNGQYLRLTADFENFRKRTSREKEDLELQVKCSTISLSLIHI